MITCRPADLLSPELEKYTEEAGELAKCEEDVLSYALFPQVASKFLEDRNNGGAKKEEVAAEPVKTDVGGVKDLYIDDRTVNAL